MTANSPLGITSLAIGLTTILIVIGLVYVELGDISPGTLSAAHAQHPDLSGADHCAACHGGPNQSMEQACLSCHEDIAEQIDRQSGFHGNLTTTEKSEASLDCGSCHGEHQGTSFPITNRRSFSLAGIPDQAAFDHQGLDFQLSGKHLTVGCEACHPNAQLEILAEGQKRFLGLNQSCTACHQDTHQGNYGSDCGSCHGQEHPFPKVAEFEHTLAFSLVGAHGKAACTDCHKPESEHGVATLLASRNRVQQTRQSISQALGSKPSLSATAAESELFDQIKWPQDDSRSCQDCHVSPHSLSFLRLASAELGIQSDRSCQHCHPATHHSFSGPKATLTRELHQATGFRLDPPHDRLACKQCHPAFGDPKRELADFHRSFPGRHPDHCRQCHRDPHLGQFEHGAFPDATCLDCHLRESFHPSTFSLADHGNTHFQLMGSHRRVKCEQCHRLRHVTVETANGKETQTVRVFQGTSTACQGCHEDPHRGQFDQGVFRGQDCRVCHDEHRFDRPTFTLQQHATTGFPLTGAHEAVSCQSCHLREGESRSIGAVPTQNTPRIAGQTLDHLRETGASAQRIFRGTPDDCSACHQDVHAGRFDRPELPQLVEGRAGCARCHTTERFDQLRAGVFDHALWAGYPLRGAHKNASCQDCHGGTVSPAAFTGPKNQTQTRNCQDCHRDPHVGQFGSTTTVDCTRCHRDGDSFRQLVFDHQTDSRFPLDRDHARLTCNACHRTQELIGGGQAVRYKPLGTQCGDCHQPVGSRNAPAGRGRW